MRLNELWTCPDTEPPGLCPWLSTALVAGSIRRGRGGNRVGTSSDAVKVKTTPDCFREDRATTYVGDFQSWVRARWFASDETRNRNDSLYHLSRSNN